MGKTAKVIHFEPARKKRIVSSQVKAAVAQRRLALFEYAIVAARQAVIDPSIPPHTRGRLAKYVRAWEKMAKRQRDTHLQHILELDKLMSKGLFPEAT